MSPVWAYTLYGLLAGTIGTGVGGAIAFIMPRKSKRFISFILEYSVGLMLSIVCFDMLPHAFEHASLAGVLISVCAGMAFSFIAETMIRKARPDLTRDRALIYTGFVIMVGIALHNFPEGLAIGSGFESDIKLGVSLIITIVLHDVPEGMATSAPFRAGGYSPFQSALFAALSGVPTGIGAFFGAAAGGVSPLFVSLCLSFAGGAMLYVVFLDMIPESKRLYGGRFGSIGCILGLLTGIIISASFS